MFFIGNIDKKARNDMLYDITKSYFSDAPDETYGSLFGENVTGYSPWALNGTRTPSTGPITTIYNGQYQNLSTVTEDGTILEAPLVKYPGLYRNVIQKLNNPVGDEGFDSAKDNVIIPGRQIDGTTTGDKFSHFQISDSSPQNGGTAPYLTYLNIVPGYAQIYLDTPYVNHDGGTVTITVPSDFNEDYYVTARFGTNGVDDLTEQQTWVKWTIDKDSNNNTQIHITIDKESADYAANNVGYLVFYFNDHQIYRNDLGNEMYNGPYSSFLDNDDDQPGNVQHFIVISPNDVYALTLQKNMDRYGGYVSTADTMLDDNPDYYPDRSHLSVEGGNDILSYQLGNVTIPISIPVYYTGTPVKPGRFLFYDEDKCTITADEVNGPGTYYARCVLKHPEVDRFQDGIQNERLIPWKVNTGTLTTVVQVEPQTQDIPLPGWSFSNTDTKSVAGIYSYQVDVGNGVIHLTWTGGDQSSVVYNESALLINGLSNDGRTLNFYIMITDVKDENCIRTFHLPQEDGKDYNLMEWQSLVFE